MFEKLKSSLLSTAVESIDHNTKMGIIREKLGITLTRKFDARLRINLNNMNLNNAVCKSIHEVL